MKALARYVKKAKVGDPFKGDKAKPWKGPEGVKDKDQYASVSEGKKILSEDAGSEATGGGKKGEVGPKVIGKNGKKRPYMC